MAKCINIKPVSIKNANEFIKTYHRHHRPTSRNSGRWALAAYDNENELIGVAIASNPVSATYMDGITLEVTRLCVKENAQKGTASFLLSKCCRIRKEMGGSRIITYTLESESGSSLKGAGWNLVGHVKPHNRWIEKSKYDGKARDKLEIYQLSKYRWEKVIGGIE